MVYFNAFNNCTFASPWPHISHVLLWCQPCPEITDFLFHPWEITKPNRAIARSLYLLEHRDQFHLPALQTEKCQHLVSFLSWWIWLCRHMDLLLYLCSRLWLSLMSVVRWVYPSEVSIFTSTHMHYTFMACLWVWISCRGSESAQVAQPLKPTYSSWSTCVCDPGTRTRVL